MVLYSDRVGSRIEKASSGGSEHSALMQVLVLLGIAVIGGLATYFCGGIAP